RECDTDHHHDRDRRHRREFRLRAETLQDVGTDREIQREKQHMTHRVPRARRIASLHQDTDRGDAAADDEERGYGLEQQDHVADARREEIDRGHRRSIRRRSARGSGSVTRGDLVLVRRERAEDLLLLARGHLEEIERASELGGYLIELGRRDAQLPVRLLEADLRLTGPDRGVLEWSAGDVAHPQGAHEFESRQAREILRVPLAELWIPRALPDDRVLDHRIAEVFDDGGDREDATE